MRTYTDLDTDITSEDDNLFRSNGKYAVVYDNPRSSSNIFTFSASDIFDAISFKLNAQAHPFPGQQDDLTSTDYGLTLNTYYYDYSAKAYFDEDPIGGGWYPPGCEILGAVLHCTLDMQNQFSICFGNSNPNDIFQNRILHLAADPIDQGPQCRAVTANVV